MIRSHKRLTARQQRFIEYLLLSMGNGAQAARRAGYSERSAKEIAHQLLQRQLIRDEARRFFKRYGLSF